jgi:L,D-transpeptidase YcbB
MTRDTLHLSVGDPLVRRAELLMTWRFINYLDDQYPDKKERSEVLLESIPAQKMNVLALARSLITYGEGRDSTTNPWYDALAVQLKGYLDSLEENDRDSLPKAHRHKTASIRMIKQRFPTASAIRRWQLDHGLIPDGHIGASFVKEYRVSLLSRIRKIVINLMRMRWMPDDNDKQLILVNIPDYRLHVLDSGAGPTSMNVVVGKAGHNTVLFSGYLDQIVFNPYWNIPPSIVQKEVMPAMSRDDHYLEEHDMQVTGSEKGLPVVRQLPGPRNELGRVKFLFPNSFNIYLHDSPHKDLFHQHRRAYSHGCIRVADAPGLAVWLLRNKQGWTKEKINKVIDEGKEKSVWVKRPVAVLICYFTTWVGEDGRLQFRPDIYGHDRRVAQHLFLD